MQPISITLLVLNEDKFIDSKYLQLLNINAVDVNNVLILNLILIGPISSLSYL